MPSYTLRYGLTYDQWVEEKAKRIRECLEKFYTSNAPIDLQTLAEQTYRERLKKLSKLSWMPVKGAFTDFKPSPFIKNFLTYLVSKLIEDGYLDPETKRVVAVPTLEYLTDLCTWKEP